MFLKLPNHTKEIIKDLYTVWLPPAPTERSLIQGWELKRSDQFWRRAAMPDFYLERRDEEKHKQDVEQKLVDDGALKEVSHFDPILEDYRRKNWMKRIHGHWFMNDGKPAYLAPDHWMYLQWTKLDHAENDGYPLFYEPQLHRFYFRQLCWEDPFCLGYLFVGPRGYGKTSEESSVIVNNITKPPHNRHAAIQSKTESDAVDVIFKEKMVGIFNNYPDFFKPQYSHGTDPSKRFVFKRKSVHSADKSSVKFGPEYELGNTLKCYPAKVKAVDGKTLADILSDEMGKTDPQMEANVYERNAVHAKAVFRNHRKTGLIRGTTTVEEMDKGGDECYEIWKESNPEERDPNGYTVSKLYKYLVTGMETQTNLADKFGRIPLKAAERQIDNEREPLLGDPYKLSIVMRKNPKSEEEAFIRDQAKCQFNVFIINQRISELRMRKLQPGRPGRLEWVNDIVDGDVEFIDDAQGPFREFITLDPFDNKRKVLNACDYIIDGDGNKNWMPVNNDILRSGGDPIKFVKTDDPRASKFGAYGYKMYDANLDHGKDMKDWISENALWRYFSRSEDPEEDYENIIKALRYWGHSIMPESNISDFNKHLYGRRYHRFIIVRKNFDLSVLMQGAKTKNTLGADQGVHSYTEVIDSYVRRIKQWVLRHGLRCNDIELLKQLLEFESKKPTKFDLVVAWGYTLMSLEAELESFMTQKQIETVDHYFRQYDISGSQSVSLARNDSQGEDSDEPNDFDDPQFVNNLLYRNV